MIISDFDKTITKKDSLFLFYMYVVYYLRCLRMFSIPIYIMFMVFSKLRWLSNSQLKGAGVYLFLKGLHRSEIEYVSQVYGRRIAINSFGRELFNSVNECLVITASLEAYVRHAVPSSYKVLGATLSYSSGEVVTGINSNLYGPNKGIALSKLYTRNYFDVFYTDDLAADSSVVPYVKLVKKIANGKVVK